MEASRLDIADFATPADRKDDARQPLGPSPSGVYTFGRFQLRPDQRRLLLRGQDVRIGGRALDMLLVLVARAGEVVPTADLIRAVWPNTHVEDTNLRVHMAALRRLLSEAGDVACEIRNIPGKGYSFILSSEGEARGQASGSGGTRDLPPAPLTVVGREMETAALIERLRLNCVSIVGPPGVGKTVLALHIANFVADSFKDGAYFVDLAATKGAASVAAALTSALRCSDSSSEPVVALARFLRSRQTLVVLDGCEHEIEAIADIASELKGAAAGLRLLVTSREPLRIEGEWVQRLQPLAVHELDRPPTAAQALRSPAVQLFVARCAANSGGYILTDEDAAAVHEICAKLDGIPLALEFAAGLRGSIGLAGLSASLADFFMDFSQGRRTALSRHQTLNAAIEWSAQTLFPEEKALFYDLSVFADGFTLDAAFEVAGRSFRSREDFEDTFGELVAKSLVASDLSGPVSRYRMFETIRNFAKVRREAMEGPSTLRERHARVILEQLRDGAKFDLVALGRELGNVREAVAWALDADRKLGVDLVVAAIPFWMGLSQVDECIAYVSRALELVGQLDSRDEIQLHIVLGWPQMQKVNGLVTGAEASEKALELARATGDTEYQLRSLWALWVHSLHSGQPARSLELAREFMEIGRGGSETDGLLGERMVARSHQFLGEHRASGEGIRRMLRDYSPTLSGADLLRFQYDQRVAAQVTLARDLWMRGDADEALGCLTGMIADCERQRHSLTLCHVLADAACPIAHSLGEYELCGRYAARLRDSTGGRALDVWNAFAAIYLADLAHRENGSEEEMHSLYAVLEGLRQSKLFLHDAQFAGILAGGLLRVGRFRDAVCVLKAAIKRASSDGEGWYLPELLRLQGEAVLAERASDGVIEARELFVRAADLAERQDSRLFNLRSVLSLSKMAPARAPTGDLQDRLRRAVSAFSSTASNREIAAARALLEN